MDHPTRRQRHGLVATFAVTAAAAVALLVPAWAGAPAPAATAAADPCAASAVARTVGQVATSTGGYLDTHPQTDAALTAISQQQLGPQSLAAGKAYFDANPMVAKDLQRLQQPLMTLSATCQLPISVSQLIGLLQGAGPAAATGAQALGVPAPGSLPAGPLPGPPAAGAEQLGGSPAVVSAPIVSGLR